MSLENFRKWWEEMELLKQKGTPKYLLLQSKDEYVAYCQNKIDQKLFILIDEIDDIFYISDLEQLVNKMLRDFYNKSFYKDFDKFLYKLINRPPPDFFNTNQIFEKFFKNILEKRWCIFQIQSLLLSYKSVGSEHIDKEIKETIIFHDNYIRISNQQKFACIVNTLLCFDSNPNIIDDETVIELLDNNVNFKLLGNRGKLLKRKQNKIGRVLQPYICDDCVGIIILFVGFRTPLPTSKNSCLIM